MAEENNTAPDKSAQAVCTDKEILRSKWRRLLTGYFLLVVTLLGISLNYSWPSDEEINKINLTPDASVSQSGTSDKTPDEQVDTTGSSQQNIHSESKTNEPAEPVSSGRLILLVVIVGALGACLHGLASLGEYVGNQDFNENWIIWYISRPFVGGILSLLFFFILLWGFDFGIKDPNGFYGFIALSGLVGLFSKQAMYKLSDIFDVVFQSKKEDQLKNKLEVKNPVPDLLKIDPAELSKKDSGIELKIEGCDFVKQSVVRANSKDLPTTFISDTKLSAKLTGINLAETDKLKICVYNPPPEGGISRTLEINVK